MPGDPGGHLADRAEAEHGDRPAVRDVRPLDGLPRGRQHVRQVDEPLVRRPLRHLDGPEVRLRDAQVLGLPAGHLPVQLGVAEQRRPRAVLADLRRLALRVQLHAAHVAAAAGDVERDDHAVAGLDVRDVRAGLLDDAHRLVAEDVALAENGPSTSYRCRSDPQIPDEVTLMIASSGSLIFGSGTVSTRTSRLPCQVTAFIVAPPRTRGGPRLPGGPTPTSRAKRPSRAAVGGRDRADGGGRVAHRCGAASRCASGPDPGGAGTRARRRPPSRSAARAG